MASQPDQVIPNSAYVRLIFVASGSTQVVNGFAAVKPAGTNITQTLANSLGAAIKASWTSNMAPVSPTTMSLVGVGVRDTSVAHQTEYIDTGGAVVGTGTGDELPKSVAFAVTLRTAQSGARFRGRNYFGPFTEANNAATGTAASAIQTACLAFVTGVQSAMTTAGLQLAVRSLPAYAETIVRTVTGDPAGPQTFTKTMAARSGAITPVTAIIARNLIWDSQRRRTSAGSVSTLYLGPDRATVDLSSDAQPTIQRQAPARGSR